NTFRRIGKVPPSGDRGDADVTERQGVTRQSKAAWRLSMETPSKRDSGITRSIMTIGRGKSEMGNSKYIEGGPVGARRTPSTRCAAKRRSADSSFAGS
ncbi:MAG TPA: hypothetical protein VGF71_12250, partial [Caulobacteraceae bacterium]